MASGAFPAQAAESSVPDFLSKLAKKKKTVIYNQTKQEEVSFEEEMLEIMDKKKSPQPITDPKEIEKAAEFASQATGVRKDFLMGMLAVESDLGRNTGKCTYEEVAAGAEESHRRGQLGRAAWNTFQERQKIIEKLAADLGYDAGQLRVSCNPGNYAGTGGALGVPQFMPDIWMHYKDEIAEIVGKKNPDPWNAKDGVVAMALLLADTPGVVDHNYYAERNSAKMYLSGTTSSAYEWYANQALYWSRNYAKLLG